MRYPLSYSVNPANKHWIAEHFSYWWHPCYRSHVLPLWKTKHCTATSTDRFHTCNLPMKRPEKHFVIWHQCLSHEIVTTGKWGSSGSLLVECARAGWNNEFSCVKSNRWKLVTSHHGVCDACNAMTGWLNSRLQVGDGCKIWCIWCDTSLW